MKLLEGAPSFGGHLPGLCPQGPLDGKLSALRFAHGATPRRRSTSTLGQTFYNHWEKTRFDAFNRNPPLSASGGEALRPSRFFLRPQAVRARSRKTCGYLHNFILLAETIPGLIRLRTISVTRRRMPFCPKTGASTQSVT